MSESTGLQNPLTPDEKPPEAKSPFGMAPTGWFVALFAVYLVLLAWIVVWKLQLPYVGEGGLRHIKLVPFAATAEDGASAPSEVMANLLLFVPFGLHLGLLMPSTARWKLAGAIAASSLGFEVTQYLLSVGSADTTDVVVNTAGGLVGIWLLSVARRRFHGRTGSIMLRVFAIGTVFALLAAAVFIASPVRYAPLRDVHVPHRTLPAPASSPIR